jgi:hypothetical protein
MLKHQDMWRPLNALCGAGLASICFSLLGCGFFAESSFDLSPESRLPKWFTLPPGISRSDVSVTMAYYIDSSGRTATFTLSSPKRMFTIAQANGKVRGLEPLKLRKEATARLAAGLAAGLPFV